MNQQTTNVIQVYKKFISEENCLKAVTFLKESKEKGSLRAGSNNRWYTSNSYVEPSVNTINAYAENAFIKYLGYLPHPIYVSDYTLMMYEVGGCMPIHKDTDLTYGKLHDGYNLWTMVAYFNDNFEGGEIEFPEHGLKVTPEKGMIVMFPGSELHVVHEVTSGTRYTFNVGFTNNPNEHFSDFPIPLQS